MHEARRVPGCGDSGEFGYFVYAAGNRCIGHEEVCGIAIEDVAHIFGCFESHVDEDFDVGELRYSVGLSGIWVSPFGLLSASIAQPIADQQGDEIQNFQFTFGTSF